MLYKIYRWNERRAEHRAKRERKSIHFNAFGNSIWNHFNFHYKFSSGKQLEDWIQYNANTWIENWNIWLSLLKNQRNAVVLHIRRNHNNKYCRFGYARWMISLKMPQSIFSERTKTDGCMVCTKIHWGGREGQIERVIATMCESEWDATEKRTRDTRGHTVNNWNETQTDVSIFGINAGDWIDCFVVVSGWAVCMTTDWWPPK